METKEILKKSIDEADLVLIGIGEEFFPSIDEFEEEYKRLIFDKRIFGLQLESLYKEIMLKKWLENHVDTKLEKAYSSIVNICKNKNFFIVSLGVDDYIYKFDLQNVVTPCGGRRQFQRKKAGETELLDIELTQKLEKEIYQAFEICDFEKLVSFDEMHKEEKLAYNNIFSEEYDENGYLEYWNRYLKWVQGTVNRKICVLELGVSLRIPSVIRFPFEKIVFYNNKASFYRVNGHLYQMTAELKEKGVSIPENAVTFLGNLFV